MDRKLCLRADDLGGSEASTKASPSNPSQILMYQLCIHCECIYVCIGKWILEIFIDVRHNLRTDGAPSRTRTDTGRILSPLSLPLDYGGQ